MRLFIKLFMESVCFTSGDFQQRERKGRIDEVRKTIVGERNEKMTAQYRTGLNWRRKKINKSVKSVTFPGEYFRNI